MNFGITISFVVGGLLLLSILAFNMNMNTATQEATISTINQQKMNSLAEVLTYDFGRLGYNDTDNSGYLETASVTTFNPIHDSGENEVEFFISYTNTVRWYANPDDTVASTTNPNDYYLYREDENGDTYRFPVTNFEIKYFVRNAGTRAWDEQTPIEMNGISDLGNLKIEVEILVESGEPSRSTYSSGENMYHRTAWKRVFVPSNVNLKQWD